MGSERSVTGYLLKVQAECPNAPAKLDLVVPEVTFGRGVGNSVIWESLQVSRRHATMEYKPETHSWRLKDTSTNGMLVNNQRVPRNVFVEVKDQDLISFVPTGSLTYKFTLGCPPLRHYNTPAMEQAVDLQQQQPRKSFDSSVQILESLSKSPKRKTANSISQDSLNISPPCERKRKRLAEAVPAEAKGTNENPEELLDIDPTPDFPFNNKIPVIQLYNPCINHKNVMNAENSLQDEKSSEDALREQLKMYRDRVIRLEGEKFETEKQLRNETQRLQTMLQLTKSENRVFQEELFKKILEVMENEYSCCICNDIFIQATVLDCGHTFCAHCISEWVKRKPECPNCRKHANNQVRHTEMENYINKFHALLPEEYLSKRNVVIADRKREVDAAKLAASRNPARRTHEHLAFAFPATDRLHISDFLQSMNDMIMQNPSARLVSGGGIQEFYRGPDVIPHRMGQPVGGIMNPQGLSGVYRVDPVMGRIETLGTFAGRRASRTRAAMPMDARGVPAAPVPRRTRAAAHASMPPGPPINVRPAPHLAMGGYAAMDVLTVD